MDRALGRSFDLAFAAAALILLALPLALIALLVKLDDPGPPVLFRQRRIGLSGRPFTLLKFRTMVRDADRLKESLRDRSSVAWPDFRLHNDPRVTRIGRLLRRTSLDELPQLLNVLRGDMALVGPRPTSFDASTYQLWQTERLEFRPGVTGPWQLWGRDTLEFDERCRLEIDFFRRASLARRLSLVPATLAAVVRRTGVG